MRRSLSGRGASLQRGGGASRAKRPYQPHRYLPLGDEHVWLATVHDDLVGKKRVIPGGAGARSDGDFKDVVKFAG